MSDTSTIAQTDRTVVTFDRIGRNHNVAPLTLDVPVGPLLARADYIAEKIYAHARPHLGSRYVDVEVGLSDSGELNGHGWIICGVRDGGTFNLVEVQS